jgi:hypothetical protein
MSPCLLVEGGGGCRGISKTCCTITVNSTPTYILLLKSAQGPCIHSLLHRSMKIQMCITYRSESCLAVDTHNIYMPKENVSSNNVQYIKI